MSLEDEVSLSTVKEDPLSIFHLPLFVREQIYDYVFDGMVIDVQLKVRCARSTTRNWSKSRTYQDREVPCPTLAITQTCVSIREESLWRFYKLSVFNLDGIFYVQEGLLKKMREDQLPEEGDSVDDEEENDAESHLDNVTRAMKLVQRVQVRHYWLHHIGWDVRTWEWTGAVYKIFPKLKQLYVHCRINSCLCNDVPLIDQFNSTTGKWDRLIWRRRRDHDPDIEDGVFLQRLARSAPRQFRIDLKIDFVGVCPGFIFGSEHYPGFDKDFGAFGTTRITLNPGREPGFSLVRWFNHEKCNRSLIRFLESYGLCDAAMEMQELIGGSRYGTWRRAIRIHSFLTSDALGIALKHGLVP